MPTVMTLRSLVFCNQPLIMENVRKKGHCRQAEAVLRQTGQNLVVFAQFLDILFQNKYRKQKRSRCFLTSVI